MTFLAVWLGVVVFFSLPHYLRSHYPTQYRGLWKALGENLRLSPQYLTALAIGGVIGVFLVIIADHVTQGAVSRSNNPLFAVLYVAIQIMAVVIIVIIVRRRLQGLRGRE